MARSLAKLLLTGAALFGGLGNGGCILDDFLQDPGVQKSLLYDAAHAGIEHALNPRETNVYINNQAQQNSQQQNSSGLEYYNGEMSDGGHYEGQMLNHHPHGRGRYIFTDGTIYDGEFREGVPNGQGTFVVPDKFRYTGGFRDGEFDGQGTFVVPNEFRYTGGFRDGEFDGQGTFTQQGVVKYTGEFRDGKAIRIKNVVYPGKLSEAFFFKKYIDTEKGWTEKSFVGIKNVFRSDEDIYAASIWPVLNKDLNGKKVTLDVLGIDTGKTAQNFGICESDNGDPVIHINEEGVHFWGSHYRLPVSDLEKKVGGHRFRVIWELDREPKKTADFTIIDAPNPSHNKSKKTEAEEIDASDAQSILEGNLKR